MTNDKEKEQLPRLIKWANDGYPPLNLTNEFKAVIELIKYCKSQSEIIQAEEERFMAFFLCVKELDHNDHAAKKKLAEAVKKLETLKESFH